MMDVQEKLRLQEMTLFEFKQELTNLRHQIIGTQTILIALMCTSRDDASPDWEGMFELIESAVGEAKERDPKRSFNEQVDGYIEILKARKNPQNPDA